MFVTCYRAIVARRVPSMASKMSKYSPMDAKVLKTESMVSNCIDSPDTGD